MLNLGLVNALWKKNHSALHEHQHSLLSSYLTHFEKYVFENHKFLGWVFNLLLVLSHVNTYEYDLPSFRTGRGQPKIQFMQLNVHHLNWLQIYDIQQTEVNVREHKKE